MTTASSFATLALLVAANAVENMPYIQMKDLEGMGVANPESSQWVSMSKDIEFLPVDDLPKKKARFLGGNSKDEDDDDEEEEGDEYDEEETTGQWESYNPYSVQPFVEGMGDYDEYQQAWRLLGFMIDCNSVSSDEDEGGHGSHSQDVTDEGCARYLLWAAYVDLEYEGSGIAEYQYWNRTTNSWDNSACQYAEHGDKNDGGDGSRCAKMDCHEEDTHFSLLGFFKHRSYDDWMGQLFKHEGMCVWSDDEYSFMKKAREAWPRGCTASGSTTPDGETLYYDIKPMPYGRIAVGLYLDAQCIVDYSSDTSVVEEVVGNFFVNNRGSHDSGDGGDYSGESLAESMERWNSAFDVWHICHPCVAHDLTNRDGSKYLADDDDNYYYKYYGNNYYGNRRKLGGESSANGETFECYDDAGYTNVNQCMKFSAKTTMETATFRDMSVARSQNSLVKYPLAGYLNSGGEYHREWASNVMTYSFLALSTICLVYSCIYLWKAKTETNYDLSGAIRDSLLAVEKGTFV